MKLFKLDGAPVAWKRAGKSGKQHYDSQAKIKENYLWILKTSYPEIIMETDPIRVAMEFQMPIPASLSRRKQTELIGLPHKVKPDADNLAKFIMDTFNGVLWSDDAIISSLLISKVYSTSPCTLINILPLSSITPSIISTSSLL